MEMSNIEFGSPDQMFHSYQHSSCAKKFHEYLKQKTGIEVVATFAYGNLEVFPQMQLYLWVRDTFASEQILQNFSCQSCHHDHPLFQSIMECLIEALRQDRNAALADVLNLLKMQQTDDASGQKQIYIQIELRSYLRCYTDDLLGATRDAVSQILTKNFPNYEHLQCCAYSMQNGSLAHNHLYLFQTPQDKEKASNSGDIEKMRKLAYDIIRAKDVHGYVSYDTYVPQIVSRRELSSEQLFYIVRE